MPNKEVYIFTKCCLIYFNAWMQNMFFQQCKWVRGSPYKVVLNIGQRRNLKSGLFKELNQPIDYTPKYTFKR